jgi:hypothetical protein
MYCFLCIICVIYNKCWCSEVAVTMYCVACCAPAGLQAICLRGGTHSVQGLVVEALLVRLNKIRAIIQTGLMRWLLGCETFRAHINMAVKHNRSREVLVTMCNIYM